MLQWVLLAATSNNIPPVIYHRFYCLVALASSRLTSSRCSFCLDVVSACYTVHRILKAGLALLGTSEMLTSLLSGIQICPWAPNSLEKGGQTRLRTGWAAWSSCCWSQWSVESTAGFANRQFLRDVTPLVTTRRKLALSCWLQFRAPQ